MSETSIGRRIMGALKKWQYWVGIAGLVITIVLAFIIIFNKDVVQELSGYGYLGLLLISALGGATVLIPVPMLAIQFAMGGVLAPWFGPAVVGPIFVGLAASLGETIGALTIYMTGYGSATPLVRIDHEHEANGRKKEGRWQRWYERTMKLMEKRGKLTLFLVSAIINPFFYPVSLAAGAVRFGVRKYFFIAWAGKMIKTTVIAYAGYYGLQGIFEALGFTL